ncbi:siderophore-iron reductase FhuF [Chengkuizengella marina]|uniref:Siderophore-iron reductase FhuF n=1 Tax=Chengkuizengella marina TaxID=2507566 RepID=A0A6N9Q4Z3_9BACL|nr:siderophore-iron reductase FhuF [Chengkuizengella marina]NBI29887.1 siderophore-iron reductase FhuF [Chengkuizengella marina]
MLSFEQEQFIKEKFHIVFEKPDHPTTTLLGKDLIDEQRLKTWLFRFAEQIKTEDLAAAASIFSKYYAHMMCAIPFIMSFYRKPIATDLKNITIYYVNKNTPYIYIVPSAWIEKSENIFTDRDNTLSTLFKNNLQPFFALLNQMTNLKTLILWENVLVYIDYLYKEGLKMVEDHSTRNLIEQDYLYITQNAKPELFGINSTNPLSIDGKMIDHPEQKGESYRIRKTCCLKYRTMEQTHCRNCPIANQ